MTIKFTPLPQSRILRLLLLLTLTSLSGMFSLVAQTVGDYRSNATTMNWTTANSWQVYTSSGWQTATTYPGQSTGTGAVTIQAGHTVTANFTATETITVNTPNATNYTAYTTPSPIGKLTINDGGRLTLTALTTYIKSMEVDVKTTTGTIYFTGNINLALPAEGVLYVGVNGLSGTQNANVNIFIGSQWYAIGTSNKAQYNFAQLMAAGGTINSVITTPVSSTICKQTSLSLQGYFTGTYNSTVSTAATPTGATYYWYDTYNGTETQITTGTILLSPTTTIATSANASHTAFNYTPTGIGIHTLRFKVSTYTGTTEFHNSETRTIIVNEPSTAPTSVTTTTNPICSGSPTTLTATGGTHGTGATYEWGTGTVGSNIISGVTSVTYTPSPAATTTYWVRRKDPAPCNTITDAATVTVTVNTPSTPPTSITGTLAVCSGGTTTLTASGGTHGTGAVYEWGTGNTVGSNIISGAAGISYTTPALATATTYWVRRKDPAPCNTTTAGVTATVTITPNMWIGATNSDWGTLSNWTCKVPDNSEEVIFSTSPQPAHDLILDTDRTIGNLTNNSNNKLIIPTGKTLTVNGTATVSSADRILIQSAASAANGSLIFTNPASNQNVQATVEMYSKAYKGTPVTYSDPLTGGSYTVSYHWQYFGVPVKNAVYNTTFETAPVSYVRKSDETLNGNSTYYDEWIQLYNNDPLTPFTGYEITQSSPKTITFRGPLVVGDQTLNLSYTPKGTTYDTGSGSNIFGNSFAAAINIDQIGFPASGVDKTVYLYNTGSLKEWLDNYYVPSSYDDANAGTYVAIPQNVSPVINREIPSMQGFMLIATANNSSVTIPYNSTSVLNNTQPQRVKQAEGQAFSYMTLDVLGKTAADRVWLFSQPETSRKYDNGWDGRKITLTPGLIFYAEEGKEQLQVSCSDNLDKTYLAIKAGKDTEYTLRINKTNLTGYQTLYLTDLVTKKVTDLSGVNELNYTFTATNTAKAEKRFLITSKDKKESTKSAKVKISGLKNTIRIENLSDESGEVLIYDMYGQLRLTAQFRAASVTEIDTPLPSSVYLVRVKSDSIDESDKVIISK